MNIYDDDVEYRRYNIIIVVRKNNKEFFFFFCLSTLRRLTISRKDATHTHTSSRAHAGKHYIYIRTRTRSKEKVYREKRLFRLPLVFGQRKYTTDVCQYDVHIRRII